MQPIVKKISNPSRGGAALPGCPAGKQSAPPFISFAGWGIFGAGFSRQIGYYNNDNFVNQIEGILDSVPNALKLHGFSLSPRPFLQAALPGSGKGYQEVMPPWPYGIGSPKS
jgi:hypothetical protein